MKVYWSTQAATTKHYSLGGLNNRNVFLTILEFGKFKIKVPATSVSPVLSSSFAKGCLSLCPDLSGRER